MKRKAWLPVILLGFAVGGNWLKSQSGIDLVASFSLQPYLPPLLRVNIRLGLDNLEQGIFCSRRSGFRSVPDRRVRTWVGVARQRERRG